MSHGDMYEAMRAFIRASVDAEVGRSLAAQPSRNGTDHVVRVTGFDPTDEAQIALLEKTIGRMVEEMAVRGPKGEKGERGESVMGPAWA